MTDLNLVTVHGRIVKNADFSTTESGIPITRFILASNRSRKDEYGNWIEDTTFIPLALFDKRAISVGPYLKKGRGVTVQGHVKTIHWEKDGEKKSFLSIVAEKILLDPSVKKFEETSPDSQPEEKFTSEEESFSNAELEFPPPEVNESFEIY